MNDDHKSLIPAETNLAEITLRVIILGIVLSLILAVANAYLALKIGLLTSASIPAAVISMSILRFFKNANILENNLVQTAASAGEAIAGGITYTIPALIIIHYWTAFSYWENFFIAIIGGVLGVMFSIPLRRVLMTDKELRFPEGQAIAEVLKVSNHQKLGIKDIILAAAAGAVLEFCQIGIKIFADHWQFWVKAKNTLMGFGFGFSPAMIGAGYLIGFNLTASLFLGAVISWFLLIPLFGYIYPEFISVNGNATEMANHLWGEKIRYVGIGAMLVAGLLTLASLFKPFLASIKISLQAFQSYADKNSFIRTDYDIPIPHAIVTISCFLLGLYFLLYQLFPTELLDLTLISSRSLAFLALIYITFIGFIFCAITAYFSGMVGVTASPGSSIVIAGLLLASFLLLLLMFSQGITLLNPYQIKACEAIAIICAAMITGMAAISNDNMQDLKVGYLLGATPWKQQVMLLLGVVCASLIIPPVMQMLFEGYGIAGVMPRADMDPSLSLPAPPAAVMAILSNAVFQQQMPWSVLLLGGFITLVIKFFNVYLNYRGKKQISILGVAIGIYLPLTSSIPLFIGGLISLLTQNHKKETRRDDMLACGLIAGAALLDVLLAIPFSIGHSPDALNIAPDFWEPFALILSILATMGLYLWFRRSVHRYTLR